ncbi:MAG: hypothetical protein JW909_01125 [Planctomycetes bacterium]|nr:hypothetical protein [Planctomycetota bacterium]
MDMLRPRLLLAARRALSGALAGFVFAAPLAALLAAAGRLLAWETLVDASLVLPAAAFAGGFFSGAARVVLLPAPGLAAWIDLHVGARGAVAAAGEIPATHPFAALVRGRAADALAEAGLSYLRPFLPAWAPLVLAAGAVWGLALLIPRAGTAQTGYVEFAGVVETVSGSAGDADGPPPETDWRKLFLVRQPPPGPAAAAADAPPVPLPPGVDVPRPDDAARGASADPGNGGRTGDVGRSTGAASSPGTGEGSGAAGPRTGHAAAGAAAPAELPLPSRWSNVAARYRAILRDRASSHLQDAPAAP